MTPSVYGRASSKWVMVLLALFCLTTATGGIQPAAAFDADAPPVSPYSCYYSTIAILQRQTMRLELQKGYQRARQEWVERETTNQPARSVRVAEHEMKKREIVLQQYDAETWANFLPSLSGDCMGEAEQFMKFLQDPSSLKREEETGGGGGFRVNRRRAAHQQGPPAEPPTFHMPNPFSVNSVWRMMNTTVAATFPSVLMVQQTLFGVGHYHYNIYKSIVREWLLLPSTQAAVAGGAPAYYHPPLQQWSNSKREFAAAIFLQVMAVVIVFAIILHLFPLVLLCFYVRDYLYLVWYRGFLMYYVLGFSSEPVSVSSGIYRLLTQPKEGMKVYSQAALHVANRMSSGELLTAQTPVLLVSFGIVVALTLLLIVVLTRLQRRLLKWVW